MDRVRRGNPDIQDAIHCDQECVKLAILIPSGRGHKLEELNACLLGDAFVTHFFYCKNAIQVLEVANITFIMLSILLPYVSLDTFTTDKFIFAPNVALGVPLPATALFFSLVVVSCVFHPMGLSIGFYRIIFLMTTLICNAKVQEASQDWSVAYISNHCSRYHQATTTHYSSSACGAMEYELFWFGTSLSGFPSCTHAMENMGIVIDRVVALQWAALVASFLSMGVLCYMLQKFKGRMGDSADIVVGTLAAYNGRTS